MKDQSRIDMSHQLYLENVELRKKHRKAYDELVILEHRMIQKVKNDELYQHRSDFDRDYSEDDYSALREMAYHFEYLGYMVMNQKVEFDLIFDPITYPDWLYNHSMMLRYNASLLVPDFWDGIEALYLVYETARLKSLKRRMTNSYKPIRKITFWVYNHRFTFGLTRNFHLKMRLLI